MPWGLIAPSRKRRKLNRDLPPIDDSLTTEKIFKVIAKVRRIGDRLDAERFFGPELVAILDRRVDALVNTGADVVESRRGFDALPVVAAVRLIDLANVPRRASELHALLTWMSALLPVVETECEAAADVHVEIGCLIDHCEFITKLVQEPAAAA